MAALLNFLNMKYPDAKDINDNYDGKNHMILPVKLQKIVYYKQELFLFNYVDMSLGGKGMITLLVKENGQFYKLPLINYDSLFNRLVSLFTSNGGKVELNTLPSRIETKAPVNLSTFLQQLRQNSLAPVQTKMRMIIYFDSSTGKYYWDKECTSEIKGAPDILGKKDGNIIYGNGDTDYVIEEVKRVSMAIPIYYNEANGNYYSDPDCKNRIPNTSGFPKNPEEGTTIHAEGNSFYVVHRVNKRINGLLFDNPDDGLGPNNPSDNVQTAFGYLIYYNEADNKFYSDAECDLSLEHHPVIIKYRRNFPNKKPKEGENIGNGFIVHLIFVKKDNYARGERNLNVQDIYYDDVSNSFYYDKEFKYKIENVFELDMLLYFDRIPKDGDEILVNNNQTKFIIHRVDKKKYVQQIYYDTNTNNYYSDKECNVILNNILQLEIYQLDHPVPTDRDLIEESENLFLRINVVTKNKTK